MDDVKVLTDIFASLGAKDPASWAASQVREGIPQLARFVFLRQAWKNVVSPNDSGWMTAVCEQSRLHPERRGSDAARAIERVTAMGVCPEDLTVIVRTMQSRLLAAITYLIDDPGDLEESVRDISWGLFQLRADGTPAAPLTGLHESVIETDPYP